MILMTIARFDHIIHSRHNPWRFHDHRTAMREKNFVHRGREKGQTDMTQSSWKLGNYDIDNINWSDVHRENVVNNVGMSILRAPWQNDLYKNKHTEQHKNTQNTKTQQAFRIKKRVCVFRIFLSFFMII